MSYEMRMLFIIWNTKLVKISEPTTDTSQTTALTCLLN